VQKRIEGDRVAGVSVLVGHALVRLSRRTSSSLSVVFLQDVQGSIDAKRPCPPSKQGRPSGAAEAAAAVLAPPAQADTTAPTTSAGPKLAAPPQPAAASPCMVKTDLREFIAAQRNAVSGTLALNPGQTSSGERKAYKWPTKTLGSQVGGSLTKLTGQDSDATGSGHRACGSSYRIGKKAA